MKTVYHGTKVEFSNFNTEFVFFTDNINMAKSYGNIIIEKKFDFSNLVCLDAKGENWRGFFLGDAFANEIYENMVKNDFIYYSLEELTKMRFSTNDCVRFAKELKKDFVKILNVEDYGSEVDDMIASDVYVVINKEKIKK